ncbi:MbcA/ParS/Xre antitoxin family protein [Sandaracinobacteroides saxicola]|uniref:MbcA/ParS/Xre antitoxin family protein n=1 Tax=Sandaracinobacteroides saxicola TaxID=2759707 RepID=UPI001FB054D3|nr:MbcA/ParS/Xre antitoxin family protein [Sandaracinobacteroides saxicola]
MSAARLADMLKIGMVELASLAGVSRATLSRKPTTPSADRALSPIARVLAMAADMSGSPERAALWFKHQPLPGWAGKTARDLIAEGRAQDVMDYLEAVRAGVHA